MTNMQIMETLVSREQLAMLHRQFRWRHPEWFDPSNYRKPTPNEARKITKLRERERENEEEMR